MSNGKTQIVDFKRFPSTRYQGSKRKILPWLYENFVELNFKTALDAFGGSSSVSYLLKKMGKSVTYNDKLHFNYQIGKAIIENSRIQFSETDIQDLIVKKDIFYPRIIEKNFKEIYYKDSENRWLDKVCTNIVTMNHYQPEILEFKKALAYYSLFQASLIKRPFNLFHRKNLNLRLADVKRNFGNKTTWEKSFEFYLKQFIEEANSLVFDSGNQCFSLNKSVFEIDPIGYDLVYLDPPYFRKEGSNESSNYLKCYHFLEGLSKYTEWESLIDMQTINRRFKALNDSDNFSGSKLTEKFEELIERFKNSTIVLSYKKGGIPSIDYLYNLVKKIKGNAYTVSMHYKYALNNQNGDAQKNREVLIIGI